ncbi:MAG: serine/threonine protein kinase [Azoarcus sp.]|jgi:serine/threonine protein kinase|nr:serine/threonine protein kinase [Azoarcus sp.]
MTTLVRVCPVCDTENPPERLHCLVCTSLLVDTDLRVRETAEPVAPAPPAPPAPSAPLAPHDAPAPSASPAPHDAPLICTAPDCGQSNPPGTTRCLYCDTPLVAAPARQTTPDPASFDLEPFTLEHATPSEWQRPVSRIRLPQELAAHFEIARELPVAGSEADLLVVETKEPTQAQQRLLKLYRPGIRPDKDLLTRLAQAGEHVVKFFGHGIADGLCWELMEYCAGGNLRDTLKGQLVDRDTFRQIVRELAAGVKEVHALGILHRDLKPENVLVRSRAPLTLVLTDFGIASLNEGTQLFTDTARTVKYAAPEALTGVLDAKADWWSVGMMLLEIAAGQHPFAGISEQVINHHLATRPIEISGVADADIARLCRGLLLRDPRQRWGAPEVERWLASDQTLPTPVERSVNPTAPPYRLGKQSARNGEELAVLLAASPENWQIGVRDFKRGLIQNWVRNDLKDLDLSRHLGEIGIMATHGESPELGFLRFLLAAAPDLPPLWQGQAVSRETLMRAAWHIQGGGKKAEEGKAAESAESAADPHAAAATRKAASQWLESMLDTNVLELFAEHGHDEFKGLAHEWRRMLQDIRLLWKAMREARDTSLGAKSKHGFAHFDDDDFNFPPKRNWYPLIILALTWDAFRAALRHDVERAAQAFAEDAPWFGQFLDAHELDAHAHDAAERNTNIAVLLTANRMAEAARASAEQARQQRLHQQALRRQEIAALRKRFEVALHPFLEPLPERLDGADIHGLRVALTLLHDQVGLSTKLDFLEKEDAGLAHQINALAYQAEQLDLALDEMVYATTAGRLIYDLFFSVYGWAFDFFIIWLAVGLVIKLGPASMPIILGILAASLPFWLHRRRSAARRALAQQHGLFKRSCEKFLSDGEKT